MPDPRPVQAPPPSLRQRLADGRAGEAFGWALVGLLAAAALAVSALVLTVPAPPSGPVPVGPYPQGAIAPIEVPHSRPPAGAEPASPASPFVAPAADVQSYGRAIDCLTAAVYYEAGSQSPQGQAAVAQVVLNRVRHPAYPRTVCGVVFQGAERASGCQFTFACDGALSRPPSPWGWARARAIAAAALNGRVMAGVGAATHYHADWVAPVWAAHLVRVVRIQNHIFYRWTGAWGQPQALNGLYRAGEPEISALAGLSAAVVESPPRVEAAFAPPPMPSAAAPPPEPPALVMVGIAPPELETQTPEATPERMAQSAPLGPPSSALRALAATPDPLANPGASPSRLQPPRRRIAAPSGW